MPYDTNGADLFFARKRTIGLFRLQCPFPTPS